MTQEDKELLLKDLCARLPYRVIVDISRVEEWKQLTLTPFIRSNYYDDIEKIKPYLRSMSSMTEEEKEEWQSGMYEIAQRVVRLKSYGNNTPNADVYLFSINWLLKKHFDVSGLIVKNLAIEAPEDMYKN